MIIGIPKEIKDNEKRVSVTPYGVEELVRFGNKVFIDPTVDLSKQQRGFSHKEWILNYEN